MLPLLLRLPSSQEKKSKNTFKFGERRTRSPLPSRPETEIGNTELKTKTVQDTRKPKRERFVVWEKLILIAKW